MAERLKDSSHTWSSTAQGEEGLYTLLTLERNHFNGLMLCG